MMPPLRTAQTLLMTGALLLAGCGTSHLSRMDDSGHLVGQSPVFPDIRRDAWQKEGTFPNPDDVHRVASGMNKDQLYALLGRPHFREGMIFVREWDYIFNFRGGSGAEAVTTCQFKILFDRYYRAREFYWKPGACAERVTPKAASTASPSSVSSPPAGPVAASFITPTPGTGAPVIVRRISMDADTLFAFDKSGVSDILPNGRTHLEQFAAHLTENRTLRSVRIHGFSDRLGSLTHNLQLSRERAESIRDYLIAIGIPGEKVSAIGLGPAEPVVKCDQIDRAALIDCLRPNRRVEVVVEVDR
jgi:outer membrane protein OmpA-like peptidoglycan-associated protein